MPSRPAAGPVRFGEGDIRGVLAPEAAHDAKDGGSLLPVLAFGLPGSEGTVLLLAVDAGCTASSPAGSCWTDSCRWSSR